MDGCWLNRDEIRAVSGGLLGLSYEGRASQPCIGPERADLVLAGCAILEAIMRLWPCRRLRVADRGLREGILTSLMAEDARAGGKDATGPEPATPKRRRPLAEYAETVALAAMGVIAIPMPKSPDKTGSKSSAARVR